MAHEHDPWNPNGCSACVKTREMFEDKTLDIGADEWKIYQSISLIVPIVFNKAIDLFENKKYNSAKSYFNKTLLIFEEKCKSTTRLKKYPIDRPGIHILQSVCRLLLFSAECNQKLNNFVSAMSDLSRIINTCCPLIPNRPSYNYYQTHETIYYLKKASKLRAELFESMGNSAHSLCDYITTKECDKQAKRLDERSHPNIHSLVKCNSNTLQMVEFAKNNHGWIKISPVDKHNILPKKFGHCMIEYNGKLYVFGGASKVLENQSSKIAPIFIEITVKKFNKNQYKYLSKSVPFPRSLRKYIFDKIPLRCADPIHYTNALSTIKWKHYMIVFGGNNYPFRNMLQYDLKNKRWSKITVSYNSTINALLNIGMLMHHSTVVMKNKMYIYGGCIQFQDYNNNMPIHLLACFDLIHQKWSMCGLHKNIQINPRVQGMYNIPEPRYDHCMWADSKNHSIYVAFGSYNRADAQHLKLPPQRLDIWRYNTLKKTNQWSKNEALNGNIPLARSESGYCNTLSEFYLFGGYTTQIGFDAIYNGQSDYHRYVYLGDFFTYNFETQYWKMIQSSVFPEHRALPTMCHLNKHIICLYGGYRSSPDESLCTCYNDLWLFDLNQVKRERKHKAAKFCGCCGKNSAMRKLWKCGGKNCICRYCSYRCQKIHWKRRHRYSCSK